MDSELLSEKEHEQIKLYSNPFHRECFMSAAIFITTNRSQPFQKEDIAVRASIEFQNNNTSATQKFTGTNLADVIYQMDMFIKSL